MKTLLPTLGFVIFCFTGLPIQAEIPVWLKKEGDRNRDSGSEFANASSNPAAIHPTFEGEVALTPVWRASELQLPQLGRCILLRTMALDDVIHSSRKPHHLFIRMSQEQIELFLMTHDVISKYPETNTVLFLDGRPEVDKWVLSEDKKGLFYRGDVLQLISRLEACNTAVSLAYTPDSDMTQMLYFSTIGIKDVVEAGIKEIASGMARR